MSRRRSDVHAFTVRMPTDEFEAVRREAAARGISVNEYFQRAVRSYRWEGYEVEVEHLDRYLVRLFTRPGAAPRRRGSSEAAASPST